MEDFKTCTKCEKNLPISLFNKRAPSKDGLDYRCRDCNKKGSETWRKDNPEKARAASERWRKEKPEEARKYRNKWRSENLEHARLYARDWAKKERRRNPEKAKLKDKKYRSTDLHKIARKRSYWKNPEKARARSAKQVITISDAYIVRLFRQNAEIIPAKSINQNIIELKRAQLLIARELRKVKK